MREIHHFVGGRQLSGQSGRFGDVFNPNTGEVQARVQLASEAEVAQAVANAKAVVLTPRAPCTPNFSILKNTVTTIAFNGIPNKFITTLR